MESTATEIPAAVPAGRAETTSQTVSPAEPVLSCTGLWKLFGDLPRGLTRERAGAMAPEELADMGLLAAVRSIDLQVHEGETFVIMGLSGSGKSTTVRCLSRLIEPTFGELVFQGANLLKAGERELADLRRHKMGMVFQHFALLPHLDVLGNVAFPLEVQGIPRDEREQRALKMIELVGLEGRERNFPKQLSGGQQQRVGIARSLVVEPDVWFLDEPFSALDPLIRRDMQSEFIKLQYRLHKSIVFITHDFDEAIRVADRIAIMKDGEIVQCGTAEHLVMEPATEYVKEFTRDVQRAKVVTAGSIMRGGAPRTDVDHSSFVRFDQKINDVANQVFEGEGTVGVLDGAERPVGTLHREDVLACFLSSAEG